MCVNKQDKSRFKTLEHWPFFSNLGCFLISFKFVLKKFFKMLQTFEDNTPWVYVRLEMLNHVHILFSVSGCPACPDSAVSSSR